jgi:predicted nucleotidyltransferase
MHPSIEAKKDAIASLCHEFKVRRLDVFGSALGRDFDPALSDVDFVVDFLPISEHDLLDCYFGLKQGLESLFARPVDLIELDTLRSERLRKIIDEERVQVYAVAA